MVRHFGPALEATIGQHVDPELLVRFVKQTLNKPMHVLQLELELRPNNNDLSVMSIIQGRRMTMTQSKPGLVVIDLEEMPCNDPNANPWQYDVAQLLSQRFAGRTGSFKDGEGAVPPRNSERRGIQNDASLITLFTSNYELDTSSRSALQRLPLFRHLSTVHVTAISGDDRSSFAHTYLQQCIHDRFPHLPVGSWDLQRLDIPLGEGDTRPLVRHLRMIAFYICALLVDAIPATVATTTGTNPAGTSVVASERVIMEISVVQNGHACHVQVGTHSTQLRLGTMDNLYPITPHIYDSRVRQAIQTLQETLGENDMVMVGSELSILLDFWLAKTLAPTVIVSNDAQKMRLLVAVLSTLHDIHTITNVDAGEYKMMKSLYDPHDTPNLRDDIFHFGRGANVAVELLCPSTDAQLCIREMIEDTPSMTAFSTNQSALYKAGLLFAVYVAGDITPEVYSRASLVW